MKLKDIETINWRNCIFFAGTTLGTLAAVPLYIYWRGISAFEIGMFAVWVLLTGTAITVGYHRLLAHRTFKAHPLVTFWTLFFGAAAFQESALQWASQHRDHHRFVDTDRDPYNIKEGFFYAHIGWILFRKHEIDYGNVTDLEQNPMIVRQQKHYVLWAVAAGVLLPVVIGALFGNWLGGFVFGSLARIVFVHQGTFLINSACHYFGNTTYDIDSTARDHWLIAIPTNGEGYHNFHHKFPSDYRNGVMWYHWDPSKWCIALLAKVKLVWDLKRVSKFQILATKLAVQREAAERYLMSRKEISTTPAALALLARQYDRLRELLHHWEMCARKHAEVRKIISDKSDEIVSTTLSRMVQARNQYLRVLAEWSSFLRPFPLGLVAV